MSLPWLADALRGAGLSVVEHAGWKTHARPGAWTPRYGVVHATAANRSSSDTTQIGVVRNGREGLPGPIANAAVDRRGVWHVLSAGRCNSTLTGTAGPYTGLGNTYALSVEGCNDNAGEPWPTDQYQSYVRGWAAWCQRLGWTAGHLVGHKEHTPGHKTDPTFSMKAFRLDVALVLSGEDIDMPTAKEIADAVWDADRITRYDGAGVAIGGDNPTAGTGYMLGWAVRMAGMAEALARAARIEATALKGTVAGINEVVTELAARNGLTPEQLEQLHESARAGAEQGATEAAPAIAAQIPDSLARDVIDLLVARLAG